MKRLFMSITLIALILSTFANSSCTPSDLDGDGIDDLSDNCPEIPNPEQVDRDGDEKGDVCDPCYGELNADTDSDGLCDDADNCPTKSNSLQEDEDKDGIGDICDDCFNDLVNDPDSDGLCNESDNCPNVANSDQKNSDNDNFGDACDPCPSDSRNDIDDDGVCGDLDNCPSVHNPDQVDSDSDGKGDACEVITIDEIVIGETGYDEIAHAIARDGNYYYIAGEIKDGTRSNPFVLLFDGISNEVVWTKQFSDNKYYESFRDISVTSDGGFIATGRRSDSTSSSSYTDVLVVRGDENGSSIWEKTFQNPWSGSVNSQGEGVIETSDGKFLVIGTTPPKSSTKSDGFILMLNENGIEENRIYMGGNDYDTPREVRQISENEFVFTGDIWSGSNGYSDLWLVSLAYDAVDGFSINWDKNYGGTKSDSGQSLIIENDRITVAGYTRSYGSGNNEYWMIQTNFSGNSLNTSVYDFGNKDYGYGVCQVPSGYIMTGRSYTDTYRLSVIRTDNDGIETWNYVSDLQLESTGNDIADNGFGGFIAIGYVEDTNSQNILLLSVQ